MYCELPQTKHGNTAVCNADKSTRGSERRLNIASCNMMRMVQVLVLDAHRRTRIDYKCQTVKPNKFF